MGITKDKIPPKRQLILSCYKNIYSGNFFEDGASEVQRSEARFITYSLEFRILLERCSQSHYFIGLNEDIFGMDYPTGNFLYRSSTGIRKDIKTVGRKDPVSCTCIIEL